MWGCNKVYVDETKRTVGERIKEHTAKIAKNLSAIAEHHQKTSHEPDLDNTKVLCREDKMIPRKVREAIFIRKETSPILNRDEGRELSKIYDSLLETPSLCSRTPPTASSGSGSVSRDSKLLSIRGGVMGGLKVSAKGKFRNIGYFHPSKTKLAFL